MPNGRNGAVGLNVRPLAVLGPNLGPEHAVNQLLGATNSVLEITQRLNNARNPSVQVVSCETSIWWLHKFSPDQTLSTKATQATGIISLRIHNWILVTLSHWPTWILRSELFSKKESFCKKYRSTCHITGALTSPNFPGDYPNNFDKTQRIQVDQGLVVFLEFTAFNVEYSSTCGYDHLTIVDGDGTILMEKKCGTILPPDITSRSAMVEVKFHTDGTGARAGWSLNWTPVMPGLEGVNNVNNDDFNHKWGGGGLWG